MKKEDVIPTTKPPVGRAGVPGWGADIRPADRPSVPKEKPSTVTTLRGDAPPRQTTDVKIHRSIEHVGMPPVFGTTCPPKGLSGVLRDHAYKFSEGALTHWLTLMLADRVDIIESSFADLGRGKVPNLIRERGIDAEWTHRGGTSKRSSAVMTAVVLGALVGGIALAANRARR